MTIYATIDDARNELSTTTTNTTEDAVLYNYLCIVSQRVDHFVPMTFEPMRKTIYAGIYDARVNSDLRTFRLDDWALVLNSVSVYSTTLTVGTDVRGYANGMIPFKHMQLISTSGSWQYTYVTTTGDPVVVINADWGYHDRYSEAWQTEDTLAANVASATATTITVNDADGTNWRGATPRFSAGQMIRVNSEWMRVIGTNTTTDILTVQRGINGSTAATHTSGDNVEVWYPLDDIRQGVARQAALMYKRRGSFETISQFGVGSGFVGDLTPDLLGVLQEYRNL